MIKDLPRILLVSEVTLSFSKKGMSANPTLFNLFESYTAEKIMQFSPASSLKYTPPSPPFERQVIPFISEFFPFLKNRLGTFINPLINLINLQGLDLLSIPNKKRIEAFAPEIILICPITPWCLVMGQKLNKYFDCPSLIYFMDDWIAVDKLRWFSGSIQKCAFNLLKNSAGWLMISDKLKEELSNRYQLLPKQSMIVHNPVDLSRLSGKKIPDRETDREGSFKVVYAGSIQVMHYDAVAAVAEAIFQLRCDGNDIELVLHTAPEFWNLYKQKFQLWEVTYGSLIPYHELNRYLQCADLLLVATSFLPEYAHMVRASVLTKLTDYMAAMRPIISCGPDYSACNWFIKKWDCGLVCDTNQVSEIKAFLLTQMENRYLNEKIAFNAFEVLKNNFDKSIVSSKLYDFIGDIATKK